MQRQGDPRYALKLLKRLERMVELEHVHAEIAGTSYPWARVVNPDQLLEQTLRNDQPESASIDPFWAATWRAAQGLDRFRGMLQLPTGTRILELGGGSGRAGTSAAAHGASA